MATPLSWLDGLLFGIRRVYCTVASVVVALPERPAIEFAGDVTVTDDTVNKRTLVTFTGGAGDVGSVSAIEPLENTGTDNDPVIELTGTINGDQHGSQLGGSLHAVATTSTAGFMSAADKEKLDDIGPVTFAAVNAALALADAPIAINGQKFTGVAAIENSGAIEFDAQNGVYQYKRADNLVRTDTVNHAGASTIEWVTGTTSIDETWAQHATAAGGTRTCTGQQGASGYAGGKIRSVTGAGGDARTSQARSKSTSARSCPAPARSLSLQAAGAVIGTFKRAVGPNFQISSPNSIYLVAAAGNAVLEGTSTTVLTASAGPVWIQPSSTGETRFYAASTLALTFTLPAAGAQTFEPAATATSFALRPKKAASTGATAGVPVTLAGGAGQDVAAGTNNNGGKLSLASGAAGTGGTGGTPGDVAIAVGAAEVVTVKGDGTGVLVDGDVTAKRLRSTPVAPTIGATTTFDLSQTLHPELVVTQNTTIAFTGALAGTMGTITLTQDGTGGWVVTMPADGDGVEYCDDAAAAIGTTAHRRTIWTYKVHGTSTGANRIIFLAQAFKTIP